MDIVETPVIQTSYTNKMRYTYPQFSLIKLLNKACDKYAMSKREYDSYSIYSFNLTDDIDELHTIAVYSQYVDYTIDSLDMDEELNSTYYYRDHHDLVEEIITGALKRLPGKYETYKINYCSDESDD